MSTEGNSNNTNNPAENIKQKIQNIMPIIASSSKKKSVQIGLFFIGSLFTVYKFFVADEPTKPKIVKTKQPKNPIPKALKTEAGNSDINLSNKEKSVEVPKKDETEDIRIGFLDKEVDSQTSKVELSLPEFKIDENISKPQIPETTGEQSDKTAVGKAFEKQLEKDGFVPPKNDSTQATSTQQNPQNNQYGLDPDILKALNSVRSGSSNLNTESDDNEGSFEEQMDYSAQEIGQNTSKNTKRIQNPEKTIRSGTLIEASLMNAIDSESPGNVIAIISTDVVNSNGQILIPKGSKVIGSYSSTAVAEETRVAIIWSKITISDYLEISVNASATDQLGRNGLEADVDNRYGDMIENSMLLSFLTLGTAVAAEKLAGQNTQTNITSSTASAVTGITPVNSAFQSVITNVNEISRKMAERFAKVSPRLKVPQGTALKIMINQDIQVDPL